MQMSGQVGPQFLADGVGSQPFRQGRLGELAVSELRGRYSEQSGRGNLFMARAVVTAPVIFSTAAGTGGPLLWNGSSNIKANILAIGIGITVVTTVAAALGLAWNSGQASAPTSTTAIDSSGNLYIGGANAACSTYRVGTVANAATNFLPLMQLHTGALTVDTFGMGWFDVGGLLTVPPNCWASVAASATATTTVAQIGMIWEETPL